MTRTRRWSLPAVLVSLAIAVSACGTSTASPSTASSSAGPASATPATSSSGGAPAPSVYPVSGEAPCGQAQAPDATHLKYAGNFKKISAPDAKTVVFDLCSPDVAFLAKIAFSSFAINDSDYLAKAAADGSIVEKPNGTGPYMLQEWVKGDHITMVTNPNYTGDKAAKAGTLVLNWSKEAAQRLVELQSGTVDGIDNVGPTDFDTVKADPNLSLIERPALNVFYIGMSNAYKPFDNEQVRQAVAMGIDRQRIVDNFYPAGSEVAKYFTPCAIPGGCEGDAWYEFDAAKAKETLAAAGYPDGFKTTLHLRDVVRGYLPNPTQVATDIQAQLKANLNIDATIDVQESTTYLDNANAGKLDGIHLLGWGADYPDVTNFLDVHFGAGATQQFGKHFPDIETALKTGATTADQAGRNTAYAEANKLIKQHVPMIPVAHGGSAVAYRADVQDAHSSPLGNELFSVMTPGDRQQMVFTQGGEPGGLYCADETDGESLRACEQMTESLYGYKVGGLDVEPALATKCEPNADLTQWTCTLRDGVKFADGSTLDATDVVSTFAAQWDSDNPLHKGRTSTFVYFSTLFGGFLNAPVPKPTASPSTSASPSAAPSTSTSPSASPS
jgi:peptide/nickel transport system substrate-binding protein